VISDQLWILIVVGCFVGFAFALVANYQRRAWGVLTGVLVAILVIGIGILLGVR
jgi:hypothetical protein